MTRNRVREYPTSYGCNAGRPWHNWPDPPRDDPEAEGRPLPAWADGFAVTREQEKEVRR